MKPLFVMTYMEQKCFVRKGEKFSFSCDPYHFQNQHLNQFIYMYVFFKYTYFLLPSYKHSKMIFTCYTNKAKAMGKGWIHKAVWGLVNWNSSNFSVINDFPSLPKFYEKFLFRYRNFLQILKFYVALTQTVLYFIRLNRYIIL